MTAEDEMMKALGKYRMILAVFIIATVPWTLAGQTGRVQTLRASLDFMEKGPPMVDSMLMLSKLVYPTKINEGIKLTERAMPIAQEIGYQDGYSRALGRLTLLYYNMAKNDSAALLSAIHIDHILATGDSAKLANALSLSGGIQADLGNHDEAFHELIRALGISERNELHLTSIYTYNRLARLLLTHDSPASMAYLDQAYELANNQGMYTMAAKLAVNLSIFHDSLDIKLAYLEKALVSADRMNLIDVKAAVYSSKGDCFVQQEKYSEAIAGYQKAIQLFESIQDDKNVDETRYFMARAYLYNGDFAEAEQLYIQCLPKLLEDGEPYIYQSGLHTLSQAYAGQQKYQPAYDSLLVSYELAKKYYKNNLEDQLQELNKKYDNVEKEKEITRQELLLAREKSKRWRQLLIGLGLLSLGVLFGVLYFMKQKRNRRNTQHQLELQAVEAQSLKDLNRMKSRWFENISHDIRTPLTLISAPIKDVLKMTKSANTINLLEIAERNSEHLLQLTNEMLELARLENSIIPLRPKTIKAAFEIQKTIHAFDSYAADKLVNINTHIDIDSDLILHFDFDKYEKIFNNIFKNAVQYSAQHDTVTVSVNHQDGTLVTMITDQGPGIPEDEIPRLFDKYFRASHQQSKLVEGSGLGLSIVKELIDLLSGQITVKNNQDLGTTFSFIIPTETGRLQENIPIGDVLEEQAIDEQILTATGISTILLVEDNREMLNYLSTVLSSEYQVHTAENPTIALQKLDKTAFDLIISDIMMPEMDGFTFKKRVNALSSHADIPFIFLSAKALDEDRLTGLRLGVDDYITKPFITEEVKVRIRNILWRKAIRTISQNDETLEQESGQAKDNTSIAGRASNIVFEHMEHLNFGVDQLAHELHYSARQLNRKLKQETGMTSVQFILEIRLQHARKLLLSNEFYSVKEVQHQVGIQSQSYFSRKYSERFGSTPGSVFG